MSKVRWEEMFPDELERAVAECPVAWISLGALEAHGPHMATGTDALDVHAICLLAAQRYGGVVTPPSYWHLGGGETEHEYRWWSEQGKPNMWGLFLPADVFYPLFIALIRQADLLGFKVVMAVAGHGGGPEVDCRIIAKHYMQRSPLRVCSIGWWETIPEEHVAHGGRLETAHLMHFRPDLVDMGRLPTGRSGIAPAHPSCYDASPEQARPLVAMEVEALGRTSQELLAEYRPWPAHQVMSRQEIFPFWEDIKRMEKDSLIEWP